MTRRLEELELKKIHEVQVVAETPVQVKPCPICQSYEHLVESALQFQMLGKCLEIKQMSLDNSSPTTMLHMEILTIQVGGSHPNFSWKPRAPQYQQPAQPSQQTSNLEQAIVNLSKVVGDFVGDKKSIMLNSVKELTVLSCQHPTPHVEEEEEEETKKREEIKGKKKDISEGKDHDSTVNANPEKVLIKEM
ncbi:hypothetical protein CK203_108126 [Vitis vinifera]|uniref:Uncharacterized protein n=1 Tax=Vitis vinifera TaxID=29760 RepID=A0A438DK41_VITVI|nr:hypothetical protein CK203_108126 [Vitis vinifera]